MPRAGSVQVRVPFAVRWDGGRLTRPPTEPSSWPKSAIASRRIAGTRLALPLARGRMPAQGMQHGIDTASALR